MATAAAQASATEALVNQGRAAIAHWGRLEEARACFEKASAISPRDWWYPFARIGLSQLARAEGDADGALRLLTEVEATIADWPLEPLVLIARAEIEEERGRCFLALGCLDRAALAFEAFEARADRSTLLGRWVVLRAQIDLLLAQHRAKKAWQVLLRAEADFKATAARVAAGGGQGDADPGEEGIAEVAVEVASCRRTVRAQLPMSAEECHALALESEAVFRAERPGSPLRMRAGKDAVDCWVRAGDMKRAWQCSQLLMQPPFENLQREAEILAQHVRLARLCGRPAEELEAARVALDQVAMELFAKWKQWPIRAGGVSSFQFSARREILGALLDVDGALLAKDVWPSVALKHVEAAFSLGSLSRRFGGAAPDFAVVQEELVPQGGGVLAFVFAPCSAHLLLIDAAGADLVPLPIQPDYLELLRDYRDRIEQLPGPDAAEELRRTRQVGEALASQLLPEAVKGRVRAWKGLLLVGDENFVATWQAMPLGDSWLGVEAAISHVPSFSLAWALRQRMAARAPRSDEGPELVLVGDPAIDDASRSRWGVDVLSLREEQRLALQGGYPPKRVRAFWGKDATAAQFATGDIKAARALCVIAHGVEDFERERSAGIVLAAADPAQAVLFAEGVEATKVPPLVLLGVCHAASGPQRLGEDGVQHLGGAFLWAGADSVVLASGPISLGASVDLLGACLDRHRQGDGAAEALRRGRQRIANDPLRAHPFYFAGLRLSGLGGFAEK